MPSSIQRVVSIECLSASSNQLVSLSDMSGLQFMRDLGLRGNKFFELPESLPDMVSLTRLDVHNNQIHKLPQNIGDLKKLRLFSALLYIVQGSFMDYFILISLLKTYLPKPDLILMVISMHTYLLIPYEELIFWFCGGQV